MKRSDKKILQDKSVTDLETQVESLTKELSVVRMQFAVGKLKDVKLMQKLRTKIAIAKTYIAQKKAEI